MGKRILIALILLSSGSAAATCARGLELAPGWADLTDPRSYAGEPSFRFLVHALTSEITRNLQIVETVRLAIEDGREVSFVDLARQPERVAEKQFISTSLISEQKLATWADGGLILRPHPANVVAMSSSDMGAAHGVGLQSELHELDDYAERMATDHPVRSPGELLSDTSSVEYNEVLLRGRGASGETLELRGFFIINDETGQSRVEPELRRKLTAAATRLDLPVIFLTRAREAYATTPVQIQTPVGGEPEYVTWQSEGVRHLLRLRTSKYFPTSYVGEYSAYKFMGHEEVADELNLLKFAAVLVSEIARNPELARTLAAVGLDVSPAGWTNPGGQPLVPPRRTMSTNNFSGFDFGVNLD